MRVTEFLLYLYAESPVHAGAGDSVGLLDLPVQRESSTGYPVIWGQSLKGALRSAAAEAGWGDLVKDVFGPEVATGGSGLDAGRLAVGDAQLVAMPVATLRSTFAWVTTELALGRLKRKYFRLGQDVPEVPGCPDGGAAAGDEKWADKAQEVFGPCVLEVALKPDPELGAWAKRVAGDAIAGVPGGQFFAKRFGGDLVLVGASVGSLLLTECTEVAVRVQLDDNKTVQNGPFHAEYLPAETVLAASLTLRAPVGGRAGDESDPALAKLRDLLNGRLIQVGGDQTIGKGLMWCHLVTAVAGQGN